MVAVLMRSQFKSLLFISIVFVLTVLCVLLLDTPHVEFLSPIASRDQLLSPSYGLIQPAAAGHQSKYAVATFLSHDGTQDWDESDVQNDFSFIGARMLTYQLLYANETKLRDPAISFIVLVTPTVSLAKRQQLLLDGATLVNVEPPPLPLWLRTQKAYQAYAADHLAKLRLFALLKYDRILFINPDTFLTRSIDDIFSDVNLKRPSTTLSAQRPDEVKAAEGPLPANYVFASRTDTMLAIPNDPYWHAFPVPNGDLFRMSAALFAPSLELYALLLSTLHSTTIIDVLKKFRREKWGNRWMRNAGPEHALLNYVFRRKGAMPWVELDPRWSSSWGNQKDMEAEVACIGGEFWWSGPIPVRDVWVNWKARMEAEFA